MGAAAPIAASKDQRTPMIVGAHIHSATKTAAERTAASNAPNAPLAETGTGTPTTDNASDPLAILGNFVEDAARSRKALAEDRLKHLDEQMRTLSLFDLAPGFLASHSARMASELESAASDFAGAFKTLANGDPGSSPDEYLANAYSETMAQDAGDGLRPTPEDTETAGRFASTAQMLRSILDFATQENESGNASAWTVEHARDATTRVERLMANLQASSVSTGTYW
ncbi:hypothetical protein [uncultured Hoeflea sp.]|uniref:hypothetical protein n=1 Tax=uncultured Hoeflea sp. TaxID=538666 RepID=UPI00260E2DF8|nr:hypothetical protein [uncultured Hoeflea sp.]